MTKVSVKHSVQSSDAGLVLMLTPRDAAKALAISERKLWSMTASGEIACSRAGRAVRYAVVDLQDWIARTRSASTPAVAV